nr:DEAD/DEAH box helicase [Heliobacterium chlorum]
MERLPDSVPETWDREEFDSPSAQDTTTASASKEGYSPLWPVLTFPLTPAQEAASEQLLHWLADNSKERREALVWAACGAGKTEVAFAAIAQVLRRGGRVLFAVPRRDVVLELTPRLQSAFPGIPVTTLYGGSRERFGTSPLVVATTHQAIRFYRAFDLVVLDEVDAFPYQGSAMLYHAVARSRKRHGPVILMTATPDGQMKGEVRAKRMQLVSIPARHHGHPLPVPQILLEKEWRWDREQLIFPEKLLTFLHRSVEGDLSQVFLFVPSVFLAHRVGESLKAATRLPPFNDFKGTWVEYSHSRDPDREAKRQRFSRQLFPIFVTTSIMERGITVPRANVVVLFAENERIYDERTLIQMAGRAGRSTERPYGDVWFVATKITAAMQEAVDAIHWLNGQAQKQGFLLSDEKAAQ